MSENIESVKQVVADLKKWSRQNRENGRESVADKFDALVVPLEDAVSEMVRLYGLTSALPPDLGNIHDLPSELIEELSVGKGDELEDQLVTVINAYGDEASLDQILVGLYRKFSVTQKRRFIQNKLYRMPGVWNVEGRKGVYTTSEPEPSSVETFASYATPDEVDSDIPF